MKFNSDQMKTFGSLLLVCGLATGALAQNDSVRVLRATPTSSPVLDGFLEAAWWQTPAGSDFVQLNPKEGAAATERTEVRVAFSPTALYVAFRCYDSEPAKIISNLTKRDRPMTCDRVFLLLDTYHDHRTGYYFITNPHGVQSDGIMYSDADVDQSWDGYWEVETARDDSGWTAEFKIPLSTLRFKDNAGEQIWGFNAQRYIERSKESSYWQPVTRDRGRRVSGFGHLSGLFDLKPGAGMELRPYAVANFVEEGPQPLKSENGWDNLGLDVKYRLASNLTLDATYNPDFAQIEADDEVINLSDYPIYLEEKRPFFLEGMSVMDVPSEVFYSRRITDPEAGAKISGKVGGLSIMALAARNRNQERQNEDFAVLGVKRDIFSKSQVSFFLTDKEKPGADYARVWATTTRIQIGDPWVIEGGVGQSFKPDKMDNNWAYSVEAGYFSDKYSGEFSHETQMRDFDSNDAGWIRYTDFHQDRAWLQWAPRPEKWGMRRIWSNLNFGIESLTDFSHVERWGELNLSFETMNYLYFGSGCHLSSSYRRNYDFVGAPDGYDNVGEYRFEHYDSFWQWIWFETDFSKPAAFGINYSQGDFRDGYEHDASATLKVRLRDNFEVTLQEEYSHVKSASEVNDGAATDFLVARNKVEWTISRRLFTRLNVQYLHSDQLFLTNALIGYNFAPESYFYLVYDDQRDDLAGWDSVQERKIKMKLSYFFQI